MWLIRFRWNKLIAIAFLFGTIVLIKSCGTKPEETIPTKAEKYLIQYPLGFDTINSPADNLLTVDGVALGKKLFFDASFSADGKISCGSCHKPEFAFADTVVTHKGVHDSSNIRNTPSLINIGFHPYFDYDGGVPSLELQVLVPVEGEDEMQTNLLKIAEKMKKDPEYVRLSKKAYNREPDPFVIVRALASYQRSLVSSGSRYDLYKKSNGKKGMTEDEIAGMNLFFSEKTNCSKCHNGFLFSNFKFEAIGLNNTTNDSGRTRVTVDPLDVGKFKTQPLRNVAKTPPYMHDGSLKTLTDVIEFYDKGGNNKRNRSPFIKPLGLTPIEKEQLMKFLICLNDTL